MKLKLVKASEEYRKQIVKMLDEWYACGEKIVPYAIRKSDYHNFEDYCKALDNTDTRGGKAGSPRWQFVITLAVNFKFVAR